MLLPDIMMLGSSSVSGSGGPAIELVSNTVSTVSGSITLPAGGQPGDLVVVGICSSSGLATVTVPTGYTAIIDDSTDTPISQSGNSTSIGYKIMPDPVDTTATFTAPTNFAGAFAMIFRNVSNTTPLDGVAPVADSSSQLNPLCPAITTTTSDAWVVMVGFQEVDATYTAPSGYTLSFTNSSLLTAASTVAAAYKYVASPSTEAAASFSGNPGSASEAFGCSFVLRKA